MIICLIEFETMPGMEAEQQKWLNELLPIVDEMPGFRGKESYAHVSGDGRVNTVSYWDDEASLSAWTRNPRHREPTGVRRRKPNAEFVVVFGAASTIVHGGVASTVVRRRRRGAPPSDETKRPEDVPRAVEEKRPRRARVPAGVGL